MVGNMKYPKRLGICNARWTRYTFFVVSYFGSKSDSWVTKMTENSLYRGTISFVPLDLISVYFCILAAFKLIVGTTQHAFLHFRIKSYIVKIVEILSSSINYKIAPPSESSWKMYVGHYFSYFGFQIHLELWGLIWKRIFELLPRKFASFCLFSYLKREVTL